MDAIIPIATTAAQVAAVSAEESKTPVIFAAISYPETVELTGMDYVTGTSDALDTNQILDMMFTQNPDIGSVGLLYSLSEPNSEVPIADAKAYLDAKGVAYTEATANTNDEVIAAASSLIADGVDAVFTPTDNIIMAAELAIYEDFIAAGIPHYTGADSFVRNGAFATCGVNYTDLGAETADLAYQAMTGGMDGLEDYYQVAGGLITVNSETAAALAGGLVVINIVGEDRDILFSQNYACEDCGISIEELSPACSPSTTPTAPCPTCTGLGAQLKVDPDLIIPNRKLSILEGAITASGWNNIKGDSISRMYFEALSKKYGFKLTTPVEELPEEVMDVILYGTKGEKLKLTYDRENGQGHSDAGLRGRGQQPGAPLPGDPERRHAPGSGGVHG